MYSGASSQQHDGAHRRPHFQPAAPHVSSSERELTDTMPRGRNCMKAMTKINSNTSEMLSLVKICASGGEQADQQRRREVPGRLPRPPTITTRNA